MIQEPHRLLIAAAVSFSWAATVEAAPRRLASADLARYRADKIVERMDPFVRRGGSRLSVICIAVNAGLSTQTGQPLPSKLTNCRLTGPNASAEGAEILPMLVESHVRPKPSITGEVFLEFDF